MQAIDLVFEGGGAKGMLFVGALEELFRDGTRRAGRLLGTSAGAITAVTLAAGYTPEEMLAALAEKDASGRPVFAGFMAAPSPLDQEGVDQSTIRKLLRDVNLPFVPDFAEDWFDTWLTSRLVRSEIGRHLFSFIDLGGWYSAAPFLAWLERKLNEGEMGGQPRHFGGLTLEQFFDTTGVEMTLVAADTTDSRLLLLNHRTAPGCPVVWAARMSMSIPLLWQEVTWDAGWGPYRVWSAHEERLVETDLSGHTIVDGGLLSNFPIALLLSNRPDIGAVVGPTQGHHVLGLLIDERLPVPGQRQERVAGPAGLVGLRPVQRFRRLVDTATGAHDNMAVNVFARHVVRLPAAGYGTTQFDMSDDERDLLVDRGRQAMRTFLAQSALLPGPGVVSKAAVPDTTALANQAAELILEH